MVVLVFFPLAIKKLFPDFPGAAGKTTRSERIKHKKEMWSLHHSFSLRFRRRLERGQDRVRKRMKQQERKNDREEQNKRMITEEEKI